MPSTPGSITIGSVAAMHDPIPIEELAKALGLGGREHVSLVGGGGKTTTLFALGRQLVGRSILTTTTKMGRDRTGGYPVLFAPTTDELTATLDQHRAALVWGADGGGKAIGVTAQQCDRWFETTADHVVVEADGSRQRPFKAPQPFEPVIPDSTTMVVCCIGADALGRVIADQCHRPMRVAAIAGCSPYQRLTPARAAAVLLSDRGSQKNRPPGARFAVIVTNVGDRVRSTVEELADHVGSAAPLLAVAPH